MAYAFGSNFGLNIDKSIISDSSQKTQQNLSDSVNISKLTRPAEPINVYDNCKTSMLTDKGRTIQTAEVKCYVTREVTNQFGKKFTTDEQVASYKFEAPSVLKDSGLICFACKSKVYVFGDNDFELGLFDEVGEKRYNVKLWELPH